MMPTTLSLGSDDAKLTVRTTRTGAASKAGHNLLIEVTSWNATLQLSDHLADTRLTLSADSQSLRVIEGSGGIQALGDEDRASIEQTINDEVLKGGVIEFQSMGVELIDGGLRVRGELELLGARRPIAFELGLGADGRLTGEATVKQSDWGIKPYSALFGTLKVADEVKIAVDGRVPSALIARR